MNDILGHSLEMAEDFDLDSDIHVTWDGIGHGYTLHQDGEKIPLGKNAKTAWKNLNGGKRQSIAELLRAHVGVFFRERPQALIDIKKQSEKAFMKQWEPILEEFRRGRGYKNAQDFYTDLKALAPHITSIPLASKKRRSQGEDTAILYRGKSGKIEKYPSRFLVMEASLVIPSHVPVVGFDTVYPKNPEYPEGLQERRYHKDPNESLFAHTSGEKQGLLNNLGRTLVQNVFLGKLVKDPSVMDKLGQRAMNQLTAVAPYIALTGVKSNAWDIAKDLGEVISIYSNEQPKDTDVLRQVSMFGGGNYSGLDSKRKMLLFQILVDTIDKGNAFISIFKNYSLEAQKAEDRKGGVITEDLFKETKQTDADREAWALSKLASNAGYKEDSSSLTGWSPARKQNPRTLSYDSERPYEGVTEKAKADEKGVLTFNGKKQSFERAYTLLNVLESQRNNLEESTVRAIVHDIQGSVLKIQDIDEKVYFKHMESLGAIFDIGSNGKKKPLHFRFKVDKKKEAVPASAVMGVTLSRKIHEEAEKQRKDLEAKKREASVVIETEEKAPKPQEETIPVQAPREEIEPYWQRRAIDLDKGVKKEDKGKLFDFVYNARKGALYFGMEEDIVRPKEDRYRLYYKYSLWGERSGFSDFVQFTKKKKPSIGVLQEINSHINQDGKKRLEIWEDALNFLSKDKKIFIKKLPSFSIGETITLETYKDGWIARQGNAQEPKDFLVSRMGYNHDFVYYGYDHKEVTGMQSIDGLVIPVLEEFSKAFGMNFEHLNRSIKNMDRYQEEEKPEILEDKVSFEGLDKIQIRDLLKKLTDAFLDPENSEERAKAEKAIRENLFDIKHWEHFKNTVCLLKDSLPWDKFYSETFNAGKLLWFAQAVIRFSSAGFDQFLEFMDKHNIIMISKGLLASDLKGDVSNYKDSEIRQTIQIINTSLDWRALNIFKEIDSINMSGFSPQKHNIKDFLEEEPRVKIGKIIVEGEENSELWKDSLIQFQRAGIPLELSVKTGEKRGKWPIRERKPLVFNEDARVEEKPVLEPVEQNKNSDYFEELVKELAEDKEWKTKDSFGYEFHFERKNTEKGTTYFEVFASSTRKVSPWVQKVTGRDPQYIAQRVFLDPDEGSKWEKGNVIWRIKEPMILALGGGKYETRFIVVDSGFRYKELKKVTKNNIDDYIKLIVEIKNMKGEREDLSQQALNLRKLFLGELGTNTIHDIFQEAVGLGMSGRNSLLFDYFQQQTGWDLPTTKAFSYNLFKVMGKVKSITKGINYILRAHDGLLAMLWIAHELGAGEVIKRMLKDTLLFIFKGKTIRISPSILSLTKFLYESGLWEVSSKQFRQYKESNFLLDRIDPNLSELNRSNYIGYTNGRVFDWDLFRFFNFGDINLELEATIDFANQKNVYPMPERIARIGIFEGITNPTWHEFLKKAHEADIDIYTKRGYHETSFDMNSIR